MDHIAEWMCDAWGDDDETPGDFLVDVRDLLSYLRTKDIYVVNSSALSKAARNRLKVASPMPKPLDFQPKRKASL